MGVCVVFYFYFVCEDDLPRARSDRGAWGLGRIDEEDERKIEGDRVDLTSVPEFWESDLFFFFFPFSLKTRQGVMATGLVEM